MTEVRDSATVIVSEPVRGLRRGRGPARSSGSSRVTTSRVHPLVWAAAQNVLRPGQRLVIVDERTVRCVNA
jgi:hypothetical protein